NALFALGLIEEPIEIAGSPDAFWGLIIVTSLIKGVGWGSIIYLAAISGVSRDLYEAAEIDGANRFQRIINVTVPGIAPSIVTFLLLSTSGILNNSVEHILVFQNPDNISKSQVIDTMVLQYGIQKGNYQYATAIGVFKSVISCFLLIGSNFLSKKLTGRGIY
ncbi:MAG: ABC transporter permease subunit, partial [Candidatus Scatosoma sp.]